MAVFRRRWPGVSYGRGEGWHYVGATDEPAFENSWANISSSMKMAFRIREAGIVDIQGRVNGGTTTSTIFTLPVGYRPSTASWFAAVGLSTPGGDDTPVLLTVLTTGAVRAANTSITCDSVWIGGQIFIDSPAAA